MKAAVVTAFDIAPRYAEFPEPKARSSSEIVVEVLAAGLHPRVRSQATGSHYTSTGDLPLVPGIDGVGRAADGRLLFFVLPDVTLGSMAERTVIDERRSVVLPADTDPVVIAAAMNPAMSSWIALRRRIAFNPGDNVLVLGATGNAGRFAVEIARFLGAGKVIAAGRSTDRLAGLKALGATDTVRLGQADSADVLGALTADVDVVLDYVWGETTASTMTVVISGRADSERPLKWIEIGSMAGPTAAIPSAALRAARLQIIGSGQGSVATRDILAELPALAAEIARGSFAVDADQRPLQLVEQAWADAQTAAHRIVLTP